MSSGPCFSATYHLDSRFLADIPSRTRFLVTCWLALTGAVVTVIFLPDVTGLDLREQERRWRFCIEGRENDYHGIAIHPRHLSLFERYVLKQHLRYDPAKDREQRLAELRETYLHEVRSANKDEKRAGQRIDEDTSELPLAVLKALEAERLSHPQSGETVANKILPGRLGRARIGGALH